MGDSFQLKPSLLLGLASSATQIDGGHLDHTWNQWYDQGHIRDNVDPALAAGHWDRWVEDVMILRSMNVKTYRFSIEWARVEPEEGVFDENAIAHIKEEIMLLIGVGILPLLTLWHFTNPLWFEKKGGWEKYENVRLFLRYAEKMIQSFGHLVCEYVTLDEANIYSANGYITGAWPPGKRTNMLSAQVMSNLCAAHIKSYRLIHDMRRAMGFRDSKVGFGIRMQVFNPKDPRNPFHRSTAEYGERLLQSLMISAMAIGDFKLPLRNAGGDRRGIYADFHALNYFGRSTVSFAGPSVNSAGPKSDLGWEIYPQGIVECCQKLQAVVALPIYITANGVCDGHDSFRSRFLYEHLRALANSKLLIKRYYAWSFLDGFEWLAGRSVRFGLVAVSSKTMTRRKKQSAIFYEQIIAQHGVTQEMYDTFVAGQTYHS